MKATKKSYRLQVQLMKQLVNSIDTMGEKVIEHPEYLARVEFAADMLQDCADYYKTAINNYAASYSGGSDE